MRVAVLSSARWAAFRRSKHFVSLALAQLGHQVLYVDPPVSPLSLLRDRDRLADLLGPAVVRADQPGLTIAHPRALPGQNSTLGQRVNSLIVQRAIRRTLGDPELTLGFSLEARATMAGLPGRRIYYCTDSVADHPSVDPAAMRAREDTMIASADVVVACSLPLVDLLAARGVRATYVPHGVDPVFLSPPPALLPELAGRPRPWVGYVGSLNYRIGAPFLDAARRATDGGTLVLVGSAKVGGDPDPDAATTALLSRPDVVATAQKGPVDVAAYVAALDVGLAPYAPMAFNRASYPLKIPQYLAAGIPVVSTPNGATDELASLVHVATDPQQFEDSVRSALALGREAGSSSRRAAAAARPWTVVAAEILAAAA